MQATGQEIMLAYAVGIYITGIMSAFIHRMGVFIEGGKVIQILIIPWQFDAEVMVSTLAQPVGMGRGRIGTVIRRTGKGGCWLGGRGWFSLRLGLHFNLRLLRIIQAGVAAIVVAPVGVICVMVGGSAGIAVAAGAAAVVIGADAELLAAAGALHVSGFIIFSVALTHAAAGT